MQTASEGQAPRTWEEYRDYWNIKHGQWYSELTAFRDSFPEYDHPRDLIRALGIDPVVIDKTDVYVSAAHFGSYAYVRAS
jgi:hypothetical protein